MIGPWASLCLVLGQTGVPRDAAGTWADPTRSAFLIPGARTLLSGASPLAFDGLQPAASAIDFDGVRLRVPAHGLLGPSTLPAAWIDGVTLGVAAPDALEGRTLGRTLSVRPRPAPAGWHGSARLDLLSIGGTVSGELEATKTRVQLAGRFFGPPALIAPVFGIRALLGDWQARVEQPLGASTLRLLALGAVNDVSLTVSGIPVSARLLHQVVDLRLVSGRLEVGLQGSVTSLGGVIRGQQTRNELSGVEQTLSTRLLVSPRLPRGLVLRAGVDAAVTRLASSRGAQTTLPGAQAESQARRELGVALVSGALVELATPEGPFRWAVGLRGDLYGPIDAKPFASLEPRLSLLRELGPQWEIAASAGLRHQPATWLVPMPILDVAAWRFGLQQAVVGDAVVRFRPGAAHTLEARGFGSSLRRTIELSPLDDSFLPQVNLSPEAIARRTGSGGAAGGSLSWSYAHEESLWLRASWSLVASWRTLTITRFGSDGLPKGEAVATVPWQFEQQHLVQAAVGWRFGSGWSLASTITFQTGAPLMGGLFTQEQRAGVDPLRQSPRWVPLDRDQVGRSSPWLRVDARLSKRWTPGVAEVEAFLDVQQASVWAQPLGVSYGVAPATLEQQARGQAELTSRPQGSPIGFPIPMLGVEVRL